MKRYIIIILVLCYGWANAQVNMPELKFVFEAESVFVTQFADEEHSNHLTFEIKGLKTSQSKEELLSVIRAMRGVEAFSIENTPQGDLGKLQVYKYANGWWYWSMFMRMTGVTVFKIGDKIYDEQNIKH